MEAAATPGIRHYFVFNLLLQIFDGVFTYQVVSAGVPEANPLVRDTMTAMGLGWGLIYWKALACILLFSIFALRHKRYTLAVQALNVTAAVYACVTFIGLCAAYLEFG